MGSRFLNFVMNNVSHAEMLMSDGCACAGMALKFITEVFKEWLSRTSVESFVTTMRKSGVEDRLVCWICLCVRVWCSVYVLFVVVVRYRIVRAIVAHYMR